MQMKRLSILTFSLLFGLQAEAQRQLDPQRYIYPVQNVAGFCSANFGEMRPNHFHSGVDIKTDGVEGKPVVATAEGYIARIVVSPSGYGRALYVVHPEGTMSVYGHLSRFRADLDSLAADRRYRSKRNSLDIYLPEGKYPVSQGEIIGLSGNTGNSFGPHLHFEIRDMRNNSTLNLIRQGIIPVRDTISPRIEAIYYVAVDTVKGVPIHAKPRKIAVKQVAKGKYALSESVKAASAGYFIAEVTDRKNEVQNRFGIYRITQKIDGKPVIEYRADGFRIEDSRYCNTVSCYPMQLNSRCEVIRLAMQEGCPPKFFSDVKERGAVRIEGNETRRITIEVEDDCRNISTLEFDVTGGGELPQPTDIPDSLIIRRTRDFRSRFEDVTVQLPAEALYESMPFECRRASVTPAANTVEILSPVYQVMREDIPLHKAATLSIRAFVPSDMSRHAAMALVSSKGKLSYLGGTYRNGALEVKTRKLGACCIVLDTVAPAIRPRFEDGTDLRRRSSITFGVSDNFSGIKEYSAAIDNNWVPVDYSPISGTLTIKFDHRDYPYNADHTLVVTATDNCGNKAVWRGSFYR